MGCLNNSLVSLNRTSNLIIIVIVIIIIIIWIICQFIMWICTILSHRYRHYDYVWHFTRSEHYFRRNSQNVDNAQWCWDNWYKVPGSASVTRALQKTELRLLSTHSPTRKQIHYFLLKNKPVDQEILMKPRSSMWPPMQLVSCMPSYVPSSSCILSCLYLWIWHWDYSWKLAAEAKSGTAILSFTIDQWYGKLSCIKQQTKTKLQRGQWSSRGPWEPLL